MLEHLRPLQPPFLRSMHVCTVPPVLGQQAQWTTTPTRLRTAWPCSSAEYAGMLCLRQTLQRQALLDLGVCMSKAQGATDPATLAACTALWTVPQSKGCAPNAAGWSAQPQAAPSPASQPNTPLCFQHTVFTWRLPPALPGLNLEARTNGECCPGSRPPPPCECNWPASIGRPALFRQAHSKLLCVLFYVAPGLSLQPVLTRSGIPWLALRLTELLQSARSLFAPCSFRGMPAIESVVVHPLVLLSVVDHYNRVARDTRKRVIGVLLGEASKGRVDVTNSFAGAHCWARRRSMPPSC